MKKLFFLGLTILFFDAQISSAQPYNENPPSNDDCSNPEVYGGFGPNCTKIFNGTTIGATATNDIDVFSCDVSENNTTVYYSFNAGVEEVELNLLSGENINVAVLTNQNSFCNGSVEVTGNCFTNIDASAMADPMDADILFTNLKVQTNYLMAIWTDEGEATDFSFCFTRASDYECGDSVCYSLKETYADCPEECPCISSINLYSYQTGLTTDVPEAVCPEIVGDITDPANPGLYIPFSIETGDLDLSNSLVSSTIGTLFTSTNPPTPLPDNLATNFLNYLFLTEAELAIVVDVSLSFTSDSGACAANTTFAIADLIKPQIDECGGCGLEIVVDYDNATCSSPSIVTLSFDVFNAVGPFVWLSYDENTTFNVGVDLQLDLFNSNSIDLVTNDISFSVYDSGNPICAERVTFYAGNFNCRSGVCSTLSNDINTLCRLQPGISDLPVTCNEDGTLNVPIDIDSANGAVTFSPDNLVTGTGTKTDPHILSIDPNNCEPINLSVMDESDCDATPIVTINKPESIAGGIFVSTANDDVWGVQINTELGVCGTDTAVTGLAAVVNDGDTAGGQLTDFCEPTPPHRPDTVVCNQIEGKIALIDRGQCTYTQKIENAQNCGATGVVICNCQPGPGWCASIDDIFFFPYGPLENEITIPAVFMSYTDCQAIKAELNKGNDVEVCIGAPAVVEDCIKDFTVDVCNDYSIAACDDGDCGTENDKATVDASGIEICNCAGTAIQCHEGEFFNNDLCVCEDEDNNPYFSPQTGEFNCEE